MEKLSKSTGPDSNLGLPKEALDSNTPEPQKSFKEDLKQEFFEIKRSVSKYAKILLMATVLLSNTTRDMSLGKDKQKEDKIENVESNESKIEYNQNLYQEAVESYGKEYVDWVISDGYDHVRADTVSHHHENLDHVHEHEVFYQNEDDVIHFNDELAPESRKINFTIEDLDKHIKTNFPKNWFSQDKVDTINISNQENNLSEQYNLGEDSKTLAFYNTDQDKITFNEFQDLHEKNINEFISTLAHESAHANDWRTSKELSLNQRLDIMVKVKDRLLAKDRYISGYVEAINNKDEKEETVLKSEEYFAEICGEYFTHGPSRLDNKDIEIIEEVIQANDPEYDIHKKMSTYSGMEWFAKDAEKHTKEYLEVGQAISDLSGDLQKMYFDNYVFNDVGHDSTEISEKDSIVSSLKKSIWDVNESLDSVINDLSSSPGAGIDLNEDREFLSKNMPKMNKLRSLMQEKVKYHKLGEEYSKIYNNSKND